MSTVIEGWTRFRWWIPDFLCLCQRSPTIRHSKYGLKPCILHFHIRAVQYALITSVSNRTTGTILNGGSTSWYRFVWMMTDISIIENAVVKPINNILVRGVLPSLIMSLSISWRGRRPPYPFLLRRRCRWLFSTLGIMGFSFTHSLTNSVCFASCIQFYCSS